MKNPGSMATMSMHGDSTNSDCSAVSAIDAPSSSTPTQHPEGGEGSVQCRLRTRASYRHRMGLTAVASQHQLVVMLLITLLLTQVTAWGSSSSGETDYSLYGNQFTRDWLYDGSTLSFQVLGCVWGMVEDSEEAGCLEDESEDGTYNWYMMANCRRPQVAYSVFTDNGSCSSNYFVGSVSSD